MYCTQTVHSHCGQKTIFFNLYLLLFSIHSRVVEYVRKTERENENECSLFGEPRCNWRRNERAPTARDLLRITNTSRLGNRQCSAVVGISRSVNRMRCVLNAIQLSLRCVSRVYVYSIWMYLQEKKEKKKQKQKKNTNDAWESNGRTADKLLCVNSQV